MPRLAASLIALGLAGCVPAPRSVPAPARPAAAPPPMTGPTAAPSTRDFIAPTIMRLPGLESVIGADARRLGELFGAARLTVPEGDALKLQYVGSACVLEIFLYPLRPGGPPVATHVEARRASDGQAVDRASCVAALRR
ncbi:hypothetical protein [Qipengyuania sediminis]|uniref:hypothetical protein n=1 Tax=Qipengyuania sediminis TaxID=1532023 RepID=UPI00105A6D27|nr:hypothetical protein [Qipengyuania sediminis]